MFEQRVAALEIKIDRIEGKLESHDEAFRRLEDGLKFVASDIKELAKTQIDIRKKVAHIDGRLNNIPTFWQTLSLMAMLLIGIAGLIFTASRFLHP